MIRTSDYLAALAAAMGACGVALAAASAHGNGGDLGRLASEFLILHATAVLCAAVAVKSSRARRARRLTFGAGALALGTLLFSGDLAKLAFSSARLFPFAAPIGGSLMILSWGVISLAFLLPE